MILGACLMLMLVPSVVAHSSGAASTACGSMAPSHQSNPTAGTPPYRIVLPQTTYSEEEYIQVTLEGIGGVQFKGFLIEARPNADNYTTFGSIYSNTTGTSNPCIDAMLNKNVALTHSNNDDKPSITFTWQAPSSDVGDIVFVFTVVKEKAIYWVKGTSSALSFKSSKPTDAPTDAPTDTPTDAPTDAPTGAPTDVPPSQINRDPACEVTKGCFPNSLECTMNCDMLISWSLSGMDDVEFTLEKKTTENNFWIGIGFSSDTRMGDDSVTECVSIDGVVDVQMSHNVPNQKINERSNNTDFGVTLVSQSHDDGIFRCTFKRKKTAALASSAAVRRRRAVPDHELYFFDLDTEWYLLVAYGTVNQGQNDKHTDPPHISPGKINFLTVTTDEGTTPAMSDKGIITKDERCGKKFGCFHDCDVSNTCGFLLMWKESGDNIHLILKCKRLGDNVYCAVGLSNDDKMGDDSVFECVSSGDEVSVYLSYNDGKNNYRLSEDKIGLHVITATHEDGVLSCTFNRKKTFELASTGITGRKKRAVDTTASTFFDANNDYNLLYAYGTANGGFINKHQDIPTVSSQKANFKRPMDISATTVDNTLIKFHGIMMTVAWLFFANFGIFAARFYKTVWPEGMEWFDQKRWFIIHRSFMVSAFLLTAGAFTLIFIHIGGYSEIVGSDFAKSHPIVGIVVMILALVNPIMALMRPHPGTPKRIYFKFAHVTVGVSAYICSIVNIFSGFEQTAAAVPSGVRIVVWVYLGWVAIIEIISWIYDCNQNKGTDEGKSPILGYNSNKQETYELKSVGKSESAISERVPLFKVVIMVVHLVALVVLVLTASVMIGMGTGNHDHNHGNSM